MAAGEIEDGPRVLGIGVGLFLLTLLWSFTLLIILVFTRVSSVSGMLLTSLSVTISGRFTKLTWVAVLQFLTKYVSQNCVVSFHIKCAPMWYVNEIPGVCRFPKEYA